MSPRRRASAVREIDESDAQQPSVDETANEEVSGGEPTDTTRKKRISFNLTEDGQIDFSGMRESNRETVRGVLSSEAVQKQLGTSDAAVGGMAVNAESIPFLYDAVSRLYTTIAKRAFRWPDAAAQLLAYTPEEKEALTEPTKKMLELYAPKILVKHQVLMIWAVTFATITQGKFDNAASVIAQIRAEMAAQANTVHGENGAAVAATAQ